MKKSNLVKRHEQKWGLLFVVPAIIFYSLFMIYPTFNAVQTSFYKYNLMSQKSFTGITNYIKLFSSPAFYHSLWVTLVYVFLTAALIMILSLFLAILLNDAVKGRTLYRAIFFMPSVMSIVAVAIIFSGFFNTKGLANYFIGLVLPDTKLSWLSTYPYALISIIITRVWRAFGYFMVIFLAGLQNIPNTYYEAGRIDGMNWFSKFRYITWPLLTPTTVVVGLIAVVNAFQAFTEPYILTNGGPAGKTRILPIMLYDVGFRFFRMGEASAISVIIFLIISIFAIIQFRISRGTYE